MKIEINDKYRVQSDTMQIMLVQKSKVTKEGSKTFGEESTKTIGYYHTMPQALKGLVDQEILESDATSFKELVEEVRQLKAEIAALITLNKEGEFSEWLK